MKPINEPAEEAADSRSMITMNNFDKNKLTSGSPENSLLNDKRTIKESVVNIETASPYDSQSAATSDANNNK